jgi:hypothetical protein
LKIKLSSFEWLVLTLYEMKRKMSTSPTLKTPLIVLKVWDWSGEKSTVVFHPQAKWKVCCSLTCHWRFCKQVSVFCCNALVCTFQSSTRNLHPSWWITFNKVRFCDDFMNFSPLFFSFPMHFWLKKNSKKVSLKK